MRMPHHTLWRPALAAGSVVAAVLTIPLLSRLEYMRAVVWLVHEDGPLETLGALSCLAGAVLFFAAFFQPKPSTDSDGLGHSNDRVARPGGNRSIWCLLLAAMLVIMFGEEINWGERLLGFHVPEQWLDANIQHEFNLHNNRFVHAQLDENRLKFVWLLLSAAYLGALPLLAIAVPTVDRYLARLRLPLASGHLAVAVLVATSLYFALTNRKVVAGDYPGAHDVGETNECLIEIAYLVLAVQVWRALRVPMTHRFALVLGLCVAVPGVPLLLGLARSAIDPEPMLRAVTALRAGDARQRAGDPDSAIARYQESLAIVPNQIAVFLRMAGLYLRQNRIDDAQREYEVVLALDNNNAEAHARLGAIFLQAGLLPEAANHLTAAIEQAPRFAAAHYYLGLVRLEQKDPVAAAACFREALRLQPNFPRAQESLDRLEAQAS
ncbi:MAG: tetratricopeptide repeat protein [Pirellulales bacterium]|nr:tetratricopeptide repeat protein [Pirellulales bacterium]